MLSFTLSLPALISVVSVLVCVAAELMLLMISSAFSCASRLYSLGSSPKTPADPERRFKTPTETFNDGS